MSRVDQSEMRPRSLALPLVSSGPVEVSAFGETRDDRVKIRSIQIIIGFSLRNKYPYQSRRRPRNCRNR